MKRNVLTTFFCVWFGFLLCFLFVKTSASSATSCDPEGVNQGETYVGCPNLMKTASWTIVFPDGQQYWLTQSVVVVANTIYSDFHALD